MKVLVCGDRNWTDKGKIKYVMSYVAIIPDVELIIEGGARGADTLAKIVGKELNIPVQEFPAKWSLYGRAAGPIRNIEMLKENPDLVLAFHSNISISKGTAHTVREARKLGIPVKIIT